MRPSSIALLLFSPVLMFILAAPGGPTHEVSFTHGVASGDVRQFSAVLWTRVDQQALLKVEVSTTFDFTSLAFEKHVPSAEENDFTARIVAWPLSANQTYFFRWSHDDVSSDVGTFKTAPLPSTSASVRFAFTGDSDGTQVEGVRPFGDFLTFDRAREEDLDFFIYLGDTIYSDSVYMDEPATTLDEYRSKYKENREVKSLSDLLKSTSTYVIWDDHEVQNDYAGQTVDPERYVTGREAFLEYMPIRQTLLRDAKCAGNPLFRVFSWGKNVDMIILDERSCRSENVENLCLNEILPDVFFPDLFPTMPTGLRKLLRLFLPSNLKSLLPATPPPGCLNAINDPSRTMLGAVQKAALKAVLRKSDARFKFIVNEVTIQQLYTLLPYDSWVGYGAERAEILRFIRNNSIDNVIFLTSDIHANFINEVFIDRFIAPQPIALEIVTGPVATFTFEDQIRNVVGDELGESVLTAFNLLLDVMGVDCRNLDVFSYALVEVDADAGTATFTLKGEDGQVVLNEGSLLNPNPTPCVKTLGLP